MKRKYLTVYDYGSGGVWTYILAASAGDIKQRYPQLEVVEKAPPWLDSKRLDEMSPEVIDIDNGADPFLMALIAEKSL